MLEFYNMRIETHPSRSKEGSQGQISITKIKETHPSGPNAAVKALQGRIYKKRELKVPCVTRRTAFKTESLKNGKRNYLVPTERRQSRQFLKKI